MKCALKLYVAGNAPNSIRAIKNLRKIAKDLVDEQLSIEIIDILTNPTAIAEEKIIAIPTLVKTYPRPICKVIGDLSDAKNAISWLGLGREGEKSTQKSKGGKQ